MNAEEKLKELRDLQSEIDDLRCILGISAPGTVTFLARNAAESDSILVVEADGFGGATMSLVEGNYPLDYVTKLEKTFSAEVDALRAAESVVWSGGEEYPAKEFI